MWPPLDGMNHLVLLQKQCNFGIFGSHASFGVPQGSITGPLFFVTFISDLPEVVHPGKTISLHADDCKCPRIIDTVVILSQQDLDNLHQCILAIPFSESVEG